MTLKTKTAAEAGRRGPGVRSDCWVNITLARSGGVDLALKTRVESMYGDATRQLVRDELDTLGIGHAKVEIEDAGALPFVITARVETAVRRLGMEVGEGFVSEWMTGTQDPAKRDRLRRSRLYLPGNEPKFMLNAGLHKPDGVILDLEDSVAPSEKDAARLIVRNALRTIDFHGAERMVRINQGERGIEDLEFIVPHNVHVILIPKVESAEQVLRVDRRVREILASVEDAEKPGETPTVGTAQASAEGHGRAGGSRDRVSARAKARGSAQDGVRVVYLMPIVESALGAIRAYEVASATDSVVALTIGLEDYTADIGTARTKGGRESFWARSQVVNAARAAGVQPIDSVFSDVSDMEALRENVLASKALGFEGMGCIHPRQIDVVHESFAPTEAELAQAKRIVEAFEDAQKAGSAVVSLGSKMIDPPVVKRAQRVARLAKATGSG